MTLPRKNRRNIIVDDHKFHWHFHPFRHWANDTFVCVQDASGKGPLLKMQWIGNARPIHVKSAIRFALENGWKPDGDKILEIGVDSNRDPAICCLKPDGAGRYWYYDEYYGEYSPRNPNNPNLIKDKAEDGNETKD